MNEVEALQILKENRPLSLKLTDTCLQFQPTQAELNKLEKFRQLRKAGYTYSTLKLLAARAGLTPGDLGILNWFCNLQENASNQPSDYDVSPTA